MKEKDEATKEESTEKKEEEEEFIIDKDKILYEMLEEAIEATGAIGRVPGVAEFIKDTDNREAINLIMEKMLGPYVEICFNLKKAAAEIKEQLQEQGKDIKEIKMIEKTIMSDEKNRGNYLHELNRKALMPHTEMKAPDHEYAINLTKINGFLLQGDVMKSHAYVVINDMIRATFAGENWKEKGRDKIIKTLKGKAFFEGIKGKWFKWRNGPHGPIYAARWVGMYER